MNDQAPASGQHRLWIFLENLNPKRVFCLVIVSGLLLGALLWRSSIYDDAYITYRYARNIARGLGPVFNAGEKVEGCTTFLQMVVLAAFAALRINLSYVSVVISLLCLALTAVAGYRKIARAPATPYNANWSVLFPVLLATNPAMIHWTISGMETIWFMTAVFGAVLLAEREMDRNRLPILSAMVCVLAALIRPEGVTLAAALILSWLLFHRPKPIRVAVVTAVLFGLFYGIYFAWRYSYYGYLFPNTYYAKVDQSSPALLSRGFFYVVRNAVWGVFPLTTILLFYRARKAKISLLRWEKVSLTVVGAFFLQAALSGGDFMPYFRFLLPIWPLTILLTWSLLPRIKINVSGKLARLWQFLKELVAEKMPARRLVKSVLILNALMLVLGVNEFKVIGGISIVRGMEKSARLLDEILPPDALVASLAIGAMGYILDRPLIDIVGLTDEHIAHADMEIGRGVAGHEKHNTPYLLSRRPDLILICFQQEQTPSGECKQSKKRFVLPALATIYESPEFQREYAYCSYKLEKTYFSTFIRRDHRNQPGYEGWICPE